MRESQIRTCDKSCPAYHPVTFCCLRGPTPMLVEEGALCKYNLPKIGYENILKTIKGPRGSEWARDDCGNLIDLTEGLSDSFKNA